MQPKKRITTHPGEVLQREFLAPRGISQSALARHIGLRPFEVCNLANGKRAVTPRLAVMLARALGTEPQFWLGLQADFDLTALMHSEEGKRLRAIKPMQHAS